MIQDFINQFQGAYVDFDGYYGPQCVDLVQVWSQWLGGPVFWGNAVNIIDQAGSFFTRVDNAPGNYPSPGAIMVFGANADNGYAGHTSVAVSANTNSFVSFDQNYPTGNVCSLITHDYNNVIGWLVPNSQPGGGSMSTQDDLQWREFANELLYLENQLHVPTQAERQSRMGINFADAANDVSFSQEATDHLTDLFTKLYQLAFGPDRKIDVKAEITPRVLQIQNRTNTIYAQVVDIFSSLERQAYLESLQSSAQSASDAQDGLIKRILGAIGDALNKLKK